MNTRKSWFSYPLLRRLNGKVKQTNVQTLVNREAPAVLPPSPATTALAVGQSYFMVEAPSVVFV